MTKHEKKVLEALNTIVDKKRKVRDATKECRESRQNCGAAPDTR